MDVDVKPKPLLLNQWSVESIPVGDFDQNLRSLLPSKDAINGLSTLRMVEFNGVQIPTFESLYPSLLFWKLGELNVDPLKSLCLNKELAIMIGTSGSGKTRQIFGVMFSLWNLFYPNKRKKSRLFRFDKDAQKIRESYGSIQS